MADNPDALVLSLGPSRKLWVWAEPEDAATVHLCASEKRGDTWQHGKALTLSRPAAHQLAQLLRAV